MKKIFVLCTVFLSIPLLASAGIYTLHYDWDCNGTSNSAIVVTYSDGTFVTSEQGSGTWVSENGAVLFQFDMGCCPLYILSTTSLYGFMKCTDGSDACDTATYNCFWATPGLPTTVGGSDDGILMDGSVE